MSDADTGDGYPTCGYEETQSGEPCQNDGVYPDGRCGHHTEEKDSGTRLSREDKVSMRIAESTHGRLKGHVREGETLSGAIDRALDAAELIDELPVAVREALEERDGE